MKLKQNRSYSSKTLKFRSRIEAKEKTIEKFNEILNGIIDHEEQIIIMKEE